MSTDVWFSSTENDAALVNSGGALGVCRLASTVNTPERP